MNSQNTTFMMIGSSNKKQPMEYKGTKSNTGLEGVLNDFKRFYQKLQGHKKKHHLQSSNHNKAGLHQMDGIKKWIQNKFKEDSKYFVLFYSGHGHQDTGNLAIDTSEKPDGDNLELTQIVGIWKKQRKNTLNESKLFIILDSCYSGRWCYTLADLNHLSIGILAVCESNQTAKDTQNGSALINCILGGSKQFEQNFTKLMKDHRPIFINKSKKPATLKKSHLQLINRNIFQINNIHSSENDDLYEQKQGKVNQGVIYYKNGQTYVGTWNSQRQPEGKGKYSYKNGEEFDGNWLKGKYNGEGKLKMLGGFTYYGVWKDGVLDGKGQLKLTLQQKPQKDQPNNMELKDIYVDKKLEFKEGKLSNQEDIVIREELHKWN